MERKPHDCRFRTPGTREHGLPEYGDRDQDVQEAAVEAYATQNAETPDAFLLFAGAARASALDLRRFATADSGRAALILVGHAPQFGGKGFRPGCLCVAGANARKLHKIVVTLHGTILATAKAAVARCAPLQIATPPRPSSIWNRSARNRDTRCRVGSTTEAA